MQEKKLRSLVPQGRGEGSSPRLVLHRPSAGSASSALEGIRRTQETALTEGLQGSVARAEFSKNKKEFLRRVEEEVARSVREVHVRLAAVLDYTASTIHDVRNFRDNVATIRERLLGRLGGVDILPVIARGSSASYCVAEVLSGAVNDLAFFREVGNIGYKVESPVGFGISRAVQTGFFESGTKKPLHAVCYLSDSTFEGDEGYFRLTIPRLREVDAVVAGLVSHPCDSHLKAVTVPFGDHGIVVDRSNSEMDAVDVVIEFLLNMAGNRFRSEAMHRVSEQMSLQALAVSLPRRISFRDHLLLKGKNAGEITQGQTPLLKG